MSLARFSQLSALLGPIISSNFATFWRLVPTLAKYLLYLVLLSNVRSWPLAWHFRVFRPVFRVRLQHKWMQWRNMFKSRAARAKAEDEWLDSITPVGSDPFNYSVSYRSRASIDDSDFNGHLSNSSYAKTLDSARFKTALAMFPMFFRAGGWMALAATHYNFIREIPMLAPYEVRVSIGSWDQKWLYVVSKFVTKPTKKDSKSHFQQPTPPSGTDSGTEDTVKIFNASLRTPADAISSTVTPFAETQTPQSEQTSSDTETALKAVAASLASEAEPDGATLNTISISQCCFKIGRMTIPPALVLAINGFSVPPSDAPAYSATNPPPHWRHVKAIMSKPLGGSTKALQTMLKTGWRDIPEGDGRWWEEAMSGAIETNRIKRLEVLKSLGGGLVNAKGL